MQFCGIYNCTVCTVHVNRTCGNAHSLIAYIISALFIRLLSLTICLLVSFADILCKYFGSKLYNTLMLFLKDVFEEVDFF